MSDHVFLIVCLVACIVGLVGAIVICLLEDRYRERYSPDPKTLAPYCPHPLDKTVFDAFGDVRCGVCGENQT